MATKKKQNTANTSSRFKFRQQEIYHGVPIDVRAHTLSEFMQKLQAKHNEIDRGIIDRKTRLQDFAEQWLETYKSETVGDDWFDNLSYIVLRKVVPSIGNRSLGNIQPLHVQQFLNDCSHYSQEYVNKIFRATKELFDSAYKNGGLDRNFSEDLVRPKGKKSNPRRSITDREREILLQVLSGKITEDFYKTNTFASDPKPHRGNLFCKFCLYCGLRPSESAALIWKDIDFKTGILTVSRAWDKKGRSKYPKSDAGFRQIPIPEIFLNELCSCKRDPFEPATLIDGKSPTIGRRRSMWNDIRRLMNIGMGCRVEQDELITPFPLAEDFVMYNLRHTYCTDLEKAGVPINIACRLMGHSDIALTSKIYTHACFETLETARSLINQRHTVPDSVPEQVAKHGKKQQNHAF